MRPSSCAVLRTDFACTGFSLKPKYLHLAYTCFWYRSLTMRQLILINILILLTLAALNVLFFDTVTASHA